MSSLNAFVYIEIFRGLQGEETCFLLVCVPKKQFPRWEASRPLFFGEAWASSPTRIQLTADNTNLQGKSKKVGVIVSSELSRVKL